jgi:Carboxypeptidase regulatory-like domain
MNILGPIVSRSLRVSCSVAGAVALVVLSACEGGQASSPSGEGDEPGNDAGVEKDGSTPASGYVAAGSVVDTQGRPLSGVEIVVDNQLLENANETAQTGSDGRYRIELPQTAATWHVTATHSVEYHGTTYSFPLHPSDDSAFAGNTGGVRNFAWKLKGKRPDDGFYGAFVVGYNDLGDFSFALEDVELTLVPDGPLVDGSEGSTITGPLVSTGDGNALVDIPLGRYAITAKADGDPLLIRILDSGAPFEQSLTSDFETPGSLPIYRLDVELRRP